MGCCAGPRQALASGSPSLALTSSLTLAQTQVSGLAMAGKQVVPSGLHITDLVTGCPGFQSHFSIFLKNLVILNSD